MNITMLRCRYEDEDEAIVQLSERRGVENIISFTTNCDLRVTNV